MNGENYNYVNDDKNNSEFWILREFKKRARNYLNNLPDDGDTIGWLSLMQHYGTPTRLIDFSHSFYVAMYFALIDAKSDAAIWAIDHNWLLDIGHNSFDISRKGLRDEWEDGVYQAANQYLTEVLSSASRSSEESEACDKKAVIVAEPFQFNPRLGAQQGLFAIQTDLSVSFIENLQAHNRYSFEKFQKIIIKNTLRETALAHLRAMNITSETLFPGVEGFARSIPHKLMYLNN